MEAAFIAWAKQRASKLPQVELGIGDDAALLSGSGDTIVATTDSLCEGTHFLLAEQGGRRVGRKVAAVNLSDIAAMGARPWTLLVSFCLPRSSAQKTATEVFEGICEHAEAFGVSICGGDTNCWDGPLVVHITALGLVQPGKAWQRRGAQPGDLIVVSGSLGGSLLQKHLDFEPRLKLASQLQGAIRVNAATDISDGFSLDLSHVANQSGCGAIVDLPSIPISDDAHKMAEKSGKTALQHALSDGEDFELLLAIPRSEEASLKSLSPVVPLTVVGEFTSRTGLWSREPGNKLRQLPPQGFVHR